MTRETNYQHADLAAGRWGRLSLVERLANVGSEVERALNWRIKGRADFSRRAAERALEFLDLTLEFDREPAHLREVARVREILADHFFGANEYRSTERSWRSYFLPFAFAARRAALAAATERTAPSGDARIDPGSVARPSEPGDGAGTSGRPSGQS